MPDTTPVERNKHTVSFSRKVGLPNYGNKEASVFLQIDTPSLDTANGDVEAYLTQVVERISAAFVAAQGAVLDQLGIEYTLSEDGSRVEETAGSVPAPDVVTTVRNGFGGGEVVPQPDNHGNAVDLKSMSKEDKKRWLQAEWDRNPSAFYDNRSDKASGKYKSTSPDVKHKSSGEGLWF